MSASAITIPACRSLGFFAALAMLMVLVSYVFLLLLAFACVYLPWLVITNVLNLQTLALLIAGVIVAASMLWSLVPRRDKFVAPGLLLDRTAHPRLFAELDNIAVALGEALPREVYLIGDPNAWVADRGGLMGFGSRRVMGLGLPLLAALNVSQFRAVLAHEFAHYYGGDTRLGPWLHRTQMAMIRTFQNMGSLGQAMRFAVMQALYAVVFGILKWYWLLFLRAINFVSRRQEFRADELASIVAGSLSLMSGLRNIHAATLAWSAYWSTELAPMLSSGCLPGVMSGFSQFLAAPSVSEQVEKGIEAEIREGKTEPYDSHPPLRDRLVAVEALPTKDFPEDSRPASILLEDGSAAELAFLEAVNPDMPKGSLKRVAWEEHGTTVLLPAWTETVKEYGSLLQGMRVGNLFEALGQVAPIAAKIRDPKGMLLTREQRLERARSLIGTALGLALVNNGWQLHSTPGEFYLDWEGEQLNPFLLIQQLSNAGISKQAWTEKCRALGIEDLLLVTPVDKRRASENCPTVIQ